MYELRKGTMMMLTPNKDDVEMYLKAGWSLTESSAKKHKSKNKKQTIKQEINNIVEEVLEEEEIGK